MKPGLKVITRGSMPDGTDIQLEHWGKADGTGEIEIGAYPICKESMEPFRPKNQTFRLSLCRIPQETVEILYMELLCGAKTLADCTPYFYRPKEDAYCLGLEVKEAA